MAEQFDLESIGKKDPYRVPDGFFEAMQQKVMEEVAPKPRRNFRFWRISSVLIGTAAVWSAFVFIPRMMTTEESRQVSLTTARSVDNSWIEQLPDEQLQAMQELADYDLFMN